MSDLTEYLEQRKATDPEFAKDLELGNAAFKKAYRFLIEMEQQQTLTSNFLTGGDGIEFEREQVYIPLGLVERKKRPQRKKDEGSPERGAELYAEKLTPLSEDQFFEDIISEDSQVKKIAIIGEPGSGKTTRLQKIAEWLIEETDNIPIWIPLGALGQKTIREYLLEDWLRDTAKDLESPPSVWKDSLLSMLRDGKIWLLLDGVDEMGVDNPLQSLASQLSEGWISNARIALTCRLNVWEANRNDLYRYKFKVYRNLDLNREQISQFIANWFEYSSPERGKALDTALNQPGKERILNLVKNPLRLTLLCRTWEIYETNLPDTKAELYRQFVEAHYAWNRQQTSYEQREKLNKALGQLALQAIDSKESRFRLRETFVRQVMDAELFQLALNLGWLNRVGVAAENPGEKVYGFYHPTFQEYFAALVIDDWEFFLNHVPHNPDEGTYRVFESQWKEVALLWIGRKEIAEETKGIFIKSLLNLESDSESELWIYDIHAVFLAGILTAEYHNSQTAIHAVDSVIKYAFGFFDKEESRWITFLNGISKKAKSVLLEVNPEVAVQKIQNLITNIRYPYKIEAEVVLNKIANPCPPIQKQETLHQQEKIRHKENKDINNAGDEYPDLEGLDNWVLERQSNDPLDELDKRTEFLAEQLGSKTKKEKKGLELEILLESILDNPLLSVDLQYFHKYPLSEDQLNMIIDYFEYLIDHVEYIDCSFALEQFVELLDKQAAGNSRYIFRILQLLEQNVDDYYEYQVYEESLTTILKSLSEKSGSLDLEINSLKKIVSLINTFIKRGKLPESKNTTFYEVLWYCSQHLSYLDFYKACNSKPFSPVDQTSIGNTPTTQTLNQQITDLASQLQPTATTYPIVLDLGTLKGETEQSAIIKEFCYQINQRLFPENKIPTVDKVSSLKDIFIEELKERLQVKTIALILQNDKPYPELVNLCKKLTNAVSIAWITDQAVDSRFREFNPIQHNLTAILQNWLDGLG